MPSLICVTKYMEMGWGKKSLVNMTAKRALSHYVAEEERGNKRVWIPTLQCHPNPSGFMQDKDQILTSTTFLSPPYTKPLERHRHSFRDWLQRAASTPLPTCAWSLFVSSYGAAQVSSMDCIHEVKTHLLTPLFFWWIPLAFVLSPSPSLSFFNVACSSRSEILSNI